MKKENFREVGTKELQERLANAEKAYVHLKLTHAISPLDSPAKITQDRRNIARMKTELRRRELELNDK